MTILHIFVNNIDCVTLVWKMDCDARWAGHARAGYKVRWAAGFEKAHLTPAGCECGLRFLKPKLGLKKAGVRWPCPEPRTEWGMLDVLKFKSLIPYFNKKNLVFFDECFYYILKFTIYEPILPIKFVWPVRLIPTWVRTWTRKLKSYRYTIPIGVEFWVLRLKLSVCWVNIEIRYSWPK